MLSPRNEPVLYFNIRTFFSLSVTDIMLKYKKLQAAERLQNQRDTAGLVPHLAPDVTVVAASAPLPQRVAPGRPSAPSVSAPAVGSSFSVSHHVPTPHRNDAVAELPPDMAALVARAVATALKDALANKKNE